MEDWVKLSSTPLDKGVVKISKEESARVAAEKPGSGIPVSALPIAALAELRRNGLQTSLRDFLARWV
jgi:hypothetical protein